MHCLIVHITKEGINYETLCCVDIYLYNMMLSNKLLYQLFC